MYPTSNHKAQFTIKRFKTIEQKTKIKNLHYIFFDECVQFSKP